MKPRRRRTGRPADSPGPRRLRRDIIAVLVIKALALTALWLAFFAPWQRPATTDADVSRAILERPPVPTDSHDRSNR
jgi:hypothetical protein